MSWISISATDVKARLADVELTALQEQYLQAGQADPLVEIVSQVTGKIRRAVAKGGGTLGLAGTIPEELEDSAVAIIRYRLCNRLNASLITEDRRQEYRDAIEELKDVAKEASGIVAPEVEATAAPSQPLPSMAEKTRTFDRTSQEGV